MTRRLVALTLGGLLTLLLAAPASAAKRVPTPASPGFAAGWDAVDFDHGLLDGILKAHVQGGRVDYAALKRQGLPSLYEYLARIAAVKPTALEGGRDAQLAFWINAYNALTLKGILDHLPADGQAPAGFTVTGVTKFWDDYLYAVGGRWLSLNQLEHEVIRKQFKDPRVHFVLVCAARGCPWLAGEVYTGPRVSEQLDARTRLFFRDGERGYRLDAAAGTVYLSKLFEWYGDDFGWAPYKGSLDFVARHLPAAEAAALRAVGDAPKVAFLDYDWSLNRR